VEIMATTVEDLGSYTITVNWDDSILQIDSINNGSLLGSTGLTVICLPPVVTSNSATLSCITVGLLSGATGDGQLATIDFTSVGEGKSEITLDPVSVLSTTSLAMDVAVTNGDIFVISDGPHVGTFACTNNAPETSGSGDNDGFEINASDACTDDSSFALDAQTGTNNVSSCANAGKDRHVFSDFGIDDEVSGGDTIDGIELRLDVMGSASAYVCAELSWDGGNSWTSAQFTFGLGASETTRWLGSPTDTWGHAWSGGERSDGNFLVRVTSVANVPNANVFLDFVEVHVYYTH
jgi:hypothetical protein